jgi:hypothetical protein
MSLQTIQAEDNLLDVESGEQHRQCQEQERDLCDTFFPFLTGIHLVSFFVFAN